jgi:hypothetical protein
VPFSVVPGGPPVLGLPTGTWSFGYTPGTPGNPSGPPGALFEGIVYDPADRMVRSNGLLAVTYRFTSPTQGPPRPVVTAPASGASFTAGTQTTFTWTAVAGATQYLLELIGPGQQFAIPNSTQPDPNGTGMLVNATSTPVTLPTAPGTYQARVFARGPSGETLGTASDAISFTIIAPAPGLRPVMTAPTDGSVLIPGTQASFAWTAVAGAASYFLEFSDVNTSFTNPNGTQRDPVNGGAVSPPIFGSTNLSIALTLVPGDYQVRVFAVDSNGQVLGTSSDAVNFTAL